MVKYDPVLGAFRTIDGGSQNGNTDTIFAGSGLLMCINETGFQTKWSPNFTIKTNLSDVLFSVMQRFDNDEFANATAHLDFVRRLDALENGDSGGAADITIYGDAIFLEPDGRETPMQDWDGNPLSQKTVYELAQDVYSYCPKGIVINDGEMASIDGKGVMYLYIGAENIIVGQEWSDDLQDYYSTYLTDTLYEVNYLKMGVPEYSEQSVNLGYSPFTEEMAPATGWVFVEVALNGESFRTYVTVNGIKILNIGYVGSSMNERGSFFFPVFEGDTFYIGEENDEQDGSYEIKFITNIPLYNI